MYGIIQKCGVVKIKYLLVTKAAWIYFYFFPGMAKLNFYQAFF